MRLKVLMLSLIISTTTAMALLLNSNCSMAQTLNYNEIENEIESIKKFLPEGAEIIYKDGNKFPGIIKRDVDNDKKEEIVVAYKAKDIDKALFLTVLKNVGDTWVANSSLKGDGYELDVLDFTDINGDSCDEILFGLKIGGDYCKVNAIKVEKDTLDKLFSTTYSKLDIIPKDKYGNKSAQSALAIWLKDRDESYKVNIVKWNGKEFIPAKELYKHYYKIVVSYYESKENEMKDKAIYWYYLADAQSKCGLKENSLKSISKGLILDQEYPTKQQFDELKRMAK